jgi:hypothetical protein
MKGELKSSHPKQCEGCAYYHSVGRSKNHTLTKYNNWCCNLGRPCKGALGECKLKGLYKTPDQSWNDFIKNIKEGKFK